MGSNKPKRTRKYRRRKNRFGVRFKPVPPDKIAEALVEAYRQLGEYTIMAHGGTEPTTSWAVDAYNQEIGKIKPWNLY